MITKELKNKISKETKIPIEKIRLSFKSKEMDDQKQIGYYGIENDSTVQINFNLKGGMNNN